MRNKDIINFMRGTIFGCIVMFALCNPWYNIRDIFKSELNKTLSPDGIVTQKLSNTFSAVLENVDLEDKIKIHNDLSEKFDEEKVKAIEDIYNAYQENGDINKATADALNLLDDKDKELLMELISDYGADFNELIAGEDKPAESNINVFNLGEVFTSLSKPIGPIEDEETVEIKDDIDTENTEEIIKEETPLEETVNVQGIEMSRVDYECAIENYNNGNFGVVLGIMRKYLSDDEIEKYIDMFKETNE